MHGVHKSYFKKNGNVFDLETYADGEKEGRQIRYYENGNVWEDATLLDGKYHGDYYYYYENGNIKREKEYDKGVAIGEVVTYYENGERRSLARIQEGEINGELKIWDEQGELTGSINFEDGSTRAFLGKWKGDDGYVYEFRENGDVVLEMFGSKFKEDWSVSASGKLQIGNKFYHILNFQEGGFHIRYNAVFGSDKNIKATRI